MGLSGSPGGGVCISPGASQLVSSWTAPAVCTSSALEIRGRFLDVGGSCEAAGRHRGVDGEGHGGVDGEGLSPDLGNLCLAPGDRIGGLPCNDESSCCRSSRAPTNTRRRRMMEALSYRRSWWDGKDIGRVRVEVGFRLRVGEQRSDAPTRARDREAPHLIFNHAIHAHAIRDDSHPRRSRAFKRLHVTIIFPT